MKKLKVYLQYPWKYPDSPYYKYLVESPPKGITYLNAEKQRGVIVKEGLFRYANFLKSAIRKTMNLVGFSLPNAHPIKAKMHFDLVHCAHCFNTNQGVRWVADFEGAWQMYIGKKNNRVKRKVAMILKSKECKKILAWTNHVRDEVLKDFPEARDKVQVVYPAVPINAKVKKARKNVTLLFIGRYFYGKGGMEALEVMNNLTKKHKNVRGIFISQTPEKVLARYQHNKKIRFYSLVPQEKIFREIYPESDIFLYPGYGDTFGFGILETMSFGIPTITVERESKREILGLDKGFVIDTKINSWKGHVPSFADRRDLIRQLTEKTETLIKNKGLRMRMAKNCIREIKEGKFSIKRRNELLKSVYLEAIKH